jgi:hypothetical protein
MLKSIVGFLFAAKILTLTIKGMLTLKLLLNADLS